MTTIDLYGADPRRSSEMIDAAGNTLLQDVLFSAVYSGDRLVLEPP